MLVQKPIFCDIPLESIYDHDVGKTILSCIQCGMCAGSCPQGINPRKIVYLLNNGFPESILSSPDILKCVTCYQCSSKCPREIKLTEVLLPLVKESVLEDLEDVPEELQKTFENANRYGNPLGESPRKRSDWVNNSTTPIKILSEHPEPVDVLWWVESYNSYHPRNITTTLATAKILNALKVNFGIIGNDEWWAADCVRLAGEKGLFEENAEKNITTLKKYSYNSIVCSDPHSFDALKHQYPCYGLTKQVNNIIPFLYSKIKQIKPLLRTEINAKVTYHDPCVLGRHNGYFEEPRELLNAIPGINLVEMAHNRKNSLCCGGGGGGMWLDTYYKQKGLERLSDRRVKEAIATGAEILAVACPYEISRFEDSIKLLGVEDKLVVKDIIDLLAEAMG
ncbi:MAG: (Fe-S)-binding protein [Candidatus Thorarchaeota archaeon]